MHVGRSVVAQIVGAVLVPQDGEGRRKPDLSKQTARNVEVVGRQKRRRRTVARHRLRMAEVVQVVAAAPAQRRHQRKRLAASAGTSDALLIVEALGRHVRLIHGLQRTDVDPDLHRRGHGQEIDFGGRPVEFGRRAVRVVDEDPLEPAEPFGGFVGLSRELLAAQTERTGSLGESAVDLAGQEMAIPELLHETRLLLRKSAPAAGAHAGSPVQVDPIAVFAPVVRVAPVDEPNVERRRIDDAVRVVPRPEGLQDPDQFADGIGRIRGRSETPDPIRLRYLVGGRPQRGVLADPPVRTHTVRIREDAQICVQPIGVRLRFGEQGRIAESGFFQGEVGLREEHFVDVRDLPLVHVVPCGLELGRLRTAGAPGPSPVRLLEEPLPREALDVRDADVVCRVDAETNHLRQNRVRATIISCLGDRALDDALERNAITVCVRRQRAKAGRQGAQVVEAHLLDRELHRFLDAEAFGCDVADIALPSERLDQEPASEILMVTPFDLQRGLRRLLTAVREDDRLRRDAARVEQIEQFARQELRRLGEAGPEAPDRGEPLLLALRVIRSAGGAAVGAGRPARPRATIVAEGSDMPVEAAGNASRIVGPAVRRGDQAGSGVEDGGLPEFASGPLRSRLARRRPEYRERVVAQILVVPARSGIGEILQIG